jgi:GntR family transcriptional regulator
MLNIDPTSAIPIYAQIIMQVKHLIASGALRSGDALPSQREMAARLRVNPLTVARAYRDLETAGIVATERGLGTFVAEGSSSVGDSYKREALLHAARQMLLAVHPLGATPAEIQEALRLALADMYTLTDREAEE